MAVHLVILKPKYLDMVLKGQKKLECRLTKVNCPPFRRINVGELIYLKQSGGPILGTASVKNAVFYENLTPHAVEKIYTDYNSQIFGDIDFWQSHENAKYASLIWLTDIKTCEPFYIQSLGQRGWYVLDDVAQLDNIKIDKQS